MKYFKDIVSGDLIYYNADYINCLLPNPDISIYRCVRRRSKYIIEVRKIADQTKVGLKYYTPMIFESDWGSEFYKVVTQKDLILYTNIPYKTELFWELLEGTSDV